MGGEMKVTEKVMMIVVVFSVAALSMNTNVSAGADRPNKIVFGTNSKKCKNHSDENVCDLRAVLQTSGLEEAIKFHINSYSSEGCYVISDAEAIDCLVNSLGHLSDNDKTRLFIADTLKSSDQEVLELAHKIVPLVKLIEADHSVGVSPSQSSPNRSEDDENLPINNESKWGPLET